jgi:DNA sulfur modification protein DndB
MHRLRYLEVVQSRRTLLLTVMPASLVAAISYAAVRRRDEEPGAVQRVLNSSRIAGIRNYTLQTGDFPASIVLNWVSGPLVRDGNYVTIPERDRSAQIIDGQHRVEGIKAAIEERQDLRDLQLPVAIYENLDTVECANIFLSINTEQRPVSRSLVFDLYGIATEDLVDPAAVRARDIAMELNEIGKPYHSLIKFPNEPRQKGGVALSTVVAAIKPLVEEMGVFEQIGATSLENQKSIVVNFFNAIAGKYGDRWGERDNAFIYAAGFMGAMEFLQLKIIPYCVIHQNDFSSAFIANAISLERNNLILQSEVKGLGGRDAPKKVYNRLVDAFMPQANPTPRFIV